MIEWGIYQLDSQAKRVKKENNQSLVEWRIQLADKELGAGNILDLHDAKNSELITSPLPIPHHEPDYKVLLLARATPHKESPSAAPPTAHARWKPGPFAHAFLLFKKSIRLPSTMIYAF